MEDITERDAQRDLVAHVKSGMAQSVLLLQECQQCRSVQFLPRKMCASCHSRSLVFTEASGRGTLHTYSVVHRPPNEDRHPDLPYTLAVVELAEGPRIMAHVDQDESSLECDMPGSISFRQSEGEPLAVFLPDPMTTQA